VQGVNGKYQVKISNRSAALENLDDNNVDINRKRENVRQIVTILAKEINQHKSWFEEECSKLLGKTKQARLQYLQNISKMKTMRKM
jgi:hypothetical protein